jgi:transglutaminase-like putative cysteine protease
MEGREKTSTVFATIILVVSLLLLSVLSNIITGYPISRDEQTEPPDGGDAEPVSALVFAVSPAEPQLFWSVSTADYYTGSDWLKTTDSKVVEEPSFQGTNSTRIFTVELNTSLAEIQLPLPSSNLAYEDVSVQPPEALQFKVDTLGGMVQVARTGEAGSAILTYRVLWNESEIDGSQISLESTPDEIKNKYLQLPSLPPEVSALAENLQDSSYTILDQVLADVQYLRTNFVYDVERARNLDKGVPQESAVSTYLARKKGICVDASTLLAVILRIQKIPARTSFGYKPGIVRGDKLLYFTTGGHCVTEVFLPPYGWIRFDATPPLSEVPLVTPWVFKKQSSPGSSLSYGLSVTNRRDLTDNFRLHVRSQSQLNASLVPNRFRIEALKTVDVLLNITIPNNATIGDEYTVTITAVSMSQPEFAFSIVVLAQAWNITQTPTLTRLEDLGTGITRGRNFEVSGTVATDNDEPVSNMTILVLLTRDRGSESVSVGKGFSQGGIFRIECFVPLHVDIGEYKLISVSLGTTQLATSIAESDVKLRATTNVSFGPGNEFTLGYGSIHGHLSLDNGTKLVSTPVQIMVTSQADPSQKWQFQNLTFGDGSFRIRTAFDAPGLFEINATFLGNEYMMSSTMSSVATLRLESPSIQIFSESIVARGESFEIAGTVQFRNIGVWGERVYLQFDNKLLAVVETGDNGSFTWSFPVSYDTELGLHDYAASVKNGNVSVVHEVTVKSKTELKLEVVNAAEGGMFVLFHASLTDDRGTPIEGARITLENLGLSWETDENGNLTLFLGNFKLVPDGSRFTAAFGGSELYLTASAYDEIAFEPLSGLCFLIPMICPLLVGIFLACSKQLHEIRQVAVQPVEAQVPTNTTKTGEPELHEVQPLKIVLPDIDAPFPNVWGINDRLRIKISPDSNVFGEKEALGLEVLIDEESTASTELTPGGSAQLSYVFARKGEHAVRAILRRGFQQPWNTEIKIMVVDYREEMVRLYNNLLAKLEERGVKAPRQMTGREIERAVLSLLHSNPEVLSRITALFEKAEYSNHPIARRDYETMYMSMKELNVSAE